MNLKTSKVTEPTDLQKAFAQAYDASSEAEFKGLMFVEQLLALMKEQGVNRTQLAEKMGVGSSRVTAMLNGSSNFTLETLIRAGSAVGARLEQMLVPNEMKGRWVLYHKDEIHNAFCAQPVLRLQKNTGFNLETDEIATYDDANAA